MVSNIWIDWEKSNNNGNSILPYLESQTKMKSLQKFRSLVTKSKIQNMALSAQYEIVSSHNRPVHCLSLEKQENRFLLSGGLDGLVSLYDLSGRANDHKRESMKNIAIARNSVTSRGGGGTVTYLWHIIVFRNVFILKSFFISVFYYHPDNYLTNFEQFFTVNIAQPPYIFFGCIFFYGVYLF